MVLKSLFMQDGVWGRRFLALRISACLSQHLHQYQQHHSPDEHHEPVSPDVTRCALELDSSSVVLDEVSEAGYFGIDSRSVWFSAAETEAHNSSLQPTSVTDLTHYRAAGVALIREHAGIYENRCVRNNKYSLVFLFAFPQARLSSPGRSLCLLVGIQRTSCHRGCQCSLWGLSETYPDKSLSQ